MPGNYLVTTIDAKVQRAAEKALAEAIHDAPARGSTAARGRLLKADSGAAVVLDVRTGGVVAMASYPTYDPRIWLGGITTKQLAGTDRRVRRHPAGVARDAGAVPARRRRSR